MFDYFYGAQSEQFAFYRVPKVLFTNDRFKYLSAEAKTLYGILLDRVPLSAKNGWIDEQGRVKQAEWTRRVKDLENRYREEENSVIHSMVHAANLTPEQLAQIIELAAKGTVGVYPEQADEPENYSKEDMENEY